MIKTTSRILVVVLILSAFVGLSVLPVVAAEKKAEKAAKTEQAPASTSAPAATPAEKEPYPKAAGDKLATGVGETATGWTEVPKEMVDTSKESNPLVGVTVGTVKGAGEAVVKTTEGAVKTGTFFIPDQGKKAEAKTTKK
jgi:putative exosortase-associated protein (TIGR04073 family)